MTRKLLLAAFLLTLVLTAFVVHHQLTNAAPNTAPPPRHAPSLEEYAANLAPLSAPLTLTWQVVAGGGGQDVNLLDVDMVTPTEGWAVGATGPTSYGVIMYYTHTTWSRATVPTGTYSINSVAMISPTEGWAAGYMMCSFGSCHQGLLMHYTLNTGWHTVTLSYRPGGASWDWPRGMDIKGTAGWMVGSDTFFQLNGTSWTPITAPISARGVSVVSANEAWAAGQDEYGNPGLAHFSGSSWSVESPMGLPYNTRLTSIHMLNANEGWAVGYVSSSGPPPTYHCATLRYFAGVWSSVACPSSTRLRSVYMRSSNDVWAVGDLGPMLHFNGSTWTPVTPPPGASSLYSVRLVGTDDGWAVGKDGIILRLVNGDWSLAAGSNLRVQSVDSVSTYEAWYGGADGELYQWKNGTVITHTSGTPLEIIALDMVSPTVGWASAGTSPYNSGANYILQYLDGTWTITSTGVYKVNEISMIGPEEGWFSTSRDGSLLHYKDGKWEWQPIPRQSPYTFAYVTSVSMLDADHGWAAGRSETGYSGVDAVERVYTFTAGSWNMVASTPQITASFETLSIMGISPDEAWVVGWSYTCTAEGCPARALLFHFSAGTWSSLPVPDWLAFFDINKVSTTEWWAAGKLTTMEHAFLHYKDGIYTIVPAAGEDVLGVSMLPDGTGFAKGVGSLLQFTMARPYRVYLPLVIK